MLSIDNILVSEAIFQEEEHASAFVLKSSDDTEIGVIEYPFHNIKTNGNYSTHNDFTIFLLKSRFSIKQSDIWKLYLGKIENDAAFGFVFPFYLYSLTLNDLKAIIIAPNDLSFYLRFVLFPAFCHLVKNANGKADRKQNDDYALSDFYDDKTIVLITDNKRVSSLNVSIDLLSADILKKFGYVFVNNSRENIQSLPDTLKENRAFGDGVALNHISPAVANEPYILQLFQKTLKLPLHPLVRFHLLYQTIELLINKIGLEGFNTKKAAIIQLSQDIINQLSASNNSFGEIQRFLGEKVRGLNIDSKELNRINTLLDTKCNLQHKDYAELSKNAKNIHGNNNIQTLGEDIYTVRNLVTHGYHALSSNPNIDQLLDEFNWEFEKIIAAIAIFYPV